MKLAVVRVRGSRKMAPRIKKTLELLRLEKPNHCVVVEDSPQNKGMLLHAKDYIAYGSVDEDVLYKLLYKRGKKGSKLLRTQVNEAEVKKISKEIFGGKKTVEYVNPVFRLNPPSKGYKSVKKSYPEGELGHRNEMNSLLRRML